MTPSDSVQPAGDRQYDDGELIRRINSGDKLAFCDFYDRSSHPLYSVALHILNDPSAAQDVVQGIFLTLWEEAGNVDQSRESVFNWLITLTRNRAIDRLRSRNRPSTLINQSIPTYLTATHPSAKSDSADNLILREKTSTVREALTTLPAEHLQVLELAYFGGLNLQEIASQFGEPTDTVKSRIRRGLLKLRDLLNRRHD